MSHIIIVGAGAAGLMAARLLQQKNFTVTVLEAQDRIGGRIHTLRNLFSRPVDAGAEFIHGRQPLTTKLLAEANGEALLLKGQYYTIAGNKLQSDHLMEAHWGPLMQKLDALAHDVDMATFLDTHFSGAEYTSFRDQIRRYVEGYDIADLHRVSAKQLFKEWSGTDEEHQYHIPDGYERLVRYLALQVETAGGTIALSQPVSSVAWKSGSVSITTTLGQRYDADMAIITVPLGVLQKRAIAFEPSLPTYQKAIDTLGYGGVVKFILEFREPFWEQQRDGDLKDMGFVFSDAAVPTWWTRLPDKTPLLTGWLGGPPAASAPHNEQALFDMAMQSLQYIFQCPRAEIEGQLLHHHIADWMQNPYSHGAYAYPTVGATEARALLTTPVQQTLFFAGEALYDGAAMGTVEAALVSAVQVATKVVIRGDRPATKVQAQPNEATR